MQITMLTTRRGCEDGFTIRRYEEGQQYDMADSEARRFVANGWAEEVTVQDPTAMAMVSGKLNSVFRPQPTRGSAPTNPATLAAKDGYVKPLAEELVSILRKFMELEPARVDQTPYEMAVYDKGREVLARAEKEVV